MIWKLTHARQLRLAWQMLAASTFMQAPLARTLLQSEAISLMPPVSLQILGHQSPASPIAMAVQLVTGLSLHHLFPERDSLYSICSLNGTLSTPCVPWSGLSLLHRSLVGTLSTPSFPGRDSLCSICSQDGTLASCGSKEDAASSLWSWLRQSGEWQGPGAPWPCLGGEPSRCVANHHLHRTEGEVKGQWRYCQVLS